jgi:AraC-like DNA-binding protein
MGEGVAVFQGASCRVLILASRRALASHAHEEYQFIFHRGGPPVPFRIGGKTRLLFEAQALLLNPWQTHERLRGSGLPSLLVSVLVDAVWLETRRSGSRAPPKPLFGRPLVDMDAGLSEALEGFLRLAQDFRLGNQGHLEKQLVTLVDEVLDRHAGKQLDRALGVRPIDARVRRALEHARRKGAESCTIDELASVAGLSRSRFFRVFRASVGTSPQHLIDAARIARAVKLLSTSSRPISEISDALGFSNQGHFTRFFVHHLAVPPSDYRNRSAQL